jgi:hypothetical protein
LSSGDVRFQLTATTLEPLLAFGEVGDPSLEL